MVKFALVCPDETVTVLGTVKAPVLLLDKLTAHPAAGAIPLKPTVPYQLLPPLTELGCAAET
jgi:hypothetical protein